MVQGIFGSSLSGQGFHAGGLPPKPHNTINVKIVVDNDEIKGQGRCDGGKHSFEKTGGGDTGVGDRFGGRFECSERCIT